MRDFIDYLQEAFINASGGNTYDNSYSNLDLTARSLLGCQIPSGSRITLSSFVRPRFGTSYSIGTEDGWISYLYSTHPLAPTTVSRSDRIPLPDLLRCYRSLASHAPRHAVGHSLVYGRLYLPQSRLEALLATRLTPQVHLALRAVSQEDLRQGGTVLGLASWDDRAGRFSVDTLASSDGGVLGLRGLWNVTNPPELLSSDPGRDSPSPAQTQAQTAPASPSSGLLDATSPVTPLSPSSSSSSSPDKERINGRFSAGGEIYYGTLNKSGGLSLGGRFQTLPTHHGTPLTATLTFNLLGHVSATYSVMAGPWTLASQFGFNLYSYESDWAVGMELWRKKRRAAPAGLLSEVKIKERSFQAKMEWRLDHEIDLTIPSTTTTPTMTVAPPSGDEFAGGVLRCRCDQNMHIGLMYEGRYKSLLFSLGSDVDFRKLDAPFRGVGLAVQFSS
ncbi:hypothetical protein BD289DRAFT_377416 [Coniella lustricola]|uniref:Mitochondrial distribution and morphology protein 10 n=1 Tax=Coniella lustricola TaxID=2025994 RepID=A0A2T2ZVK0_9PEZI|nr:hypothetical protein BD289DRAFT_377416 [Coniella lustricola]